MCYGCYEESGSPKALHVNTIAAVAAAEALYEVHCTGGGLHCELDDDNLDYPWDAAHRQSVVDHVVKYHDTRWTSGTIEDDVALHLAVWDLMAPMTEDEKITVNGLRRGYLGIDPSGHAVVEK